MQDWELLFLGGAILATGISIGALITICAYRNLARFREKDLENRPSRNQKVTKQREIAPRTLLFQEIGSNSTAPTNHNTAADQVPENQLTLKNQASIASLWSFYTADHLQESEDGTAAIENMITEMQVSMERSKVENTMDVDSLVETFRNRLIAQGLLQRRHTTMLLRRFLAARKDNIDLAFEMFKAAEEWRLDFGADDVIDFQFPERKFVDSILPQYFHKEDCFGRAIEIMDLSNADYYKFFGPNGTTLDRYLKYFVRIQEETEGRLQYCYEANPSSNCQVLLILNVENAPYSQFAKLVPMLQAMFSILLNNYPDALGTLFIVNAPYLFTAVWRIISTWLDEGTLSKIHILGKNYEKLVEIAGADNLPQKFGGNCACPDGCENANPGIWRNSPDFEKWESIRRRDIKG
jgi:hypothetical protein